MSKEQPRLSEVAVTASAGGKVAIVKYDLSSDYFVSLSQKYDIPEGWSDADAIEFQLDRAADLRVLVDEQAQVEFDNRFEQSYLNDGA